MLANFGVDNLRFLTPVKFGDELTVTLTAKEHHPAGIAGLRRGALGRRRHPPGRRVGGQYDVLTLVAKHAREES